MTRAPDNLAKATAWQLSGACRREEADLFFPVGTSGPAMLQTAEAQAVCRSCPVIEQCLTWALEHRVEDGIWGGMTEDDRKRLRRRISRHGGARQLAECGTEAAYRRHQKRHEPIDFACAEARRIAQAERASTAVAS